MLQNHEEDGHMPDVNEEGHIQELYPTPPNFFNDTVLEEPSNTIWFVKFYSHKCSHCRDMAPIYSSVAKRVSDELPGVRKKYFLLLLVVMTRRRTGMGKSIKSISMHLLDF